MAPRCVAQAEPRSALFQGLQNLGQVLLDLPLYLFSVRFGVTETFAAFLKGHPSRCLPPPPSCQLPTQLLSSPAGSNLSKEMWGKVREVTKHLHLGIRSGSVTELLQLNKLWLCRVRLLCVCLQPSPSVGRGGRAQPQPCLCSPSSGGLGLGCGGSKERGGSSPVAAWPSTRQAPSQP